MTRATAINITLLVLQLVTIAMQLATHAAHKERIRVERELLAETQKHDALTRELLTELRKLDNDPPEVEP